jgi:hypothetical protein
VPARRIASTLFALLVTVCTAASAGAAVDAGGSLRFGFVPEKTFAGQAASISVVVRPSRARCAGSVRYTDGATQRLASIVASGGRASWRWRVPAKAALGRATASVSCNGAGRIARTFVVSGPPAAPARIVIEKRGYSQRVRFTSRDVSFGLVLSNPSPEKDALDVSVQVNFVDATNRVVKTETVNVPAVRAASQFFLGGATSIPDGTAVSSLEIVTRIGSQALRTLRAPPTADVQVLAALYDPGFVGAVQGQILNDHPSMLLASSQISTVIFDAAGNVLGGGTGYGFTSLLPGVRAYFQANVGVGAIPIDRVATAGVSVSGRYEQVG